MKIELYKESGSYCEIYQDSDLKFALTAEQEDGTIEQVHDFIKCRDFLCDAIVATQLNIKSPQIWGYSYPGDKKPAITHHTVLILSGSNFSHLEDHLKFLNEFEKENNLELSVLTDVEGSKYKIIYGDKFWMNSTVTISMYTHILRCLYQYSPLAEDFFSFLEKVESLGGNAANYQRKINSFGTKNIMKSLFHCFSVPTLPKKGMKEIDSISIIHNNGGIVTWSKSLTNKYNNSGGLYEDEVKDFYKSDTYKEIIGG